MDWVDPRDEVEQTAIEVDETLETLGETPLVGETFRQITSPVEGTIDTFYENDSKLFVKVFDEEKQEYVIKEIHNASEREKYGVNGILVTEQELKEMMLSNTDKDGNPVNYDYVARYNPTSGFAGDLIESGLGIIFNAIDLPEAVKMNRLVSNDLYQRRDLGSDTQDNDDNSNINNLFHSQGTIIGTGAMQIYNEEYGSNSINPNQNFIAVGPAVRESEWKDSVKDIGAKQKYQSNPKDPVTQLTSPTSISDVPIGLLNLIINLDEHSLENNSEYNQYLRE